MTALTAQQSALVEQYLPKVAALARVLGASVSHASVDELCSAGHEGLVEAALRYDPTGGVPFASFAHFRVRGAMLDAARRAAPGLRRRKRALRVLQATQALLEQAQRDQPAPELGDPRSLRERVAAAADVVAQVTAAVMLSRLAPVDPESVADGGQDPESVAIHRDALAKLREVIEHADADARRMITALYFDGLNMHEYAAQIGTSVSTVSRHHARLLVKLAAAMQQGVATAAPAPAVASTAVPTRPGERATASPRGPPRRPES